jgi:hypothetical protein
LVHVIPSFSVSSWMLITRKHAHGRDAGQARRAGLRWSVPTLFSGIKPIGLQSVVLQESLAGARMRRLVGYILYSFLSG